MPIYEYECCACGQVHEILQKISEDPLKTCPECGGKVNKLMSMNTFHLKGSGWYVTDYAGKKAPKTGGDSTNGDSAPKTKKPKRRKARKPPRLRPKAIPSRLKPRTLSHPPNSGFDRFVRLTFEK
jgi:putative FmdB family regulatory protein